MGTLKPGATYIYERADGVTYARESGADPSTRVAIGWDYNAKKDLTKYYNSSLWTDVLKEAETNHALHSALERAIILYYLSKENGKID
jgi:hypothetical protein